jgi:hypothetical protein
MSTPMDDGDVPQRGTRMFQIHESDLAELEKIIPAMSDSHMGEWSPRERTQLRRAKDILSNVRWNYGPHTDVEIIPAE